MTRIERRGIVVLICMAVLWFSCLPAMAASKTARASTVNQPQLSLTISPVNRNGVSDAELFSTGAVKIEIRHQFPIDEASLRVTLQFNGGPRLLDITKYFDRVDEKTLQSKMFEKIAPLLFSLDRNTYDHVISLEVTVKNKGKTIKAVRRISVYPIHPLPLMALAN